MILPFKETTFPKGAKVRRICDAPVPDGLIDPSFSFLRNVGTLFFVLQII